MTDPRPPVLDEEAIKRLIDATIAAAGEEDPSALPHLIRQRLADQTTGRFDVERYIQDALRKQKKA